MMFNVINREQSHLKTNHFNGNSVNKVIRERSHFNTNCFDEKRENGVIYKRIRSSSVSKRAPAKDRKTEKKNRGMGTPLF